MRHFKNLLRFGLAAVMATTMSFAVAQDLDQEDLDQDSDDSKEKPTLVIGAKAPELDICLLYTSPSPRDRQKSRMPSSA